uniref:Peptidoglycan recognition protein n=1 Tax=Magallana gigas TaxID=29159 RepID=K1RBE8_MAGGI
MEIKVQFISACILFHLQFSTADECACATGNVHIRSGAGTTHSILGTLPTDSCLAFKGHLSTVSGTHWANVDYHGQDGWISSTYLTFRTCSLSNSHNTGTGSHSTTGCPPIVGRSEWHARAPAHHIGPLPAVPGNVYIHHGATHGCHTKADCIKLVQSYQNYHMDTHGFCVMGDFTSRVPNNLAINAVKSLIDCGVKTGRITQNYVLKGHRDVGQTSCPGDKLYALINTWPHYHH